MSLLAIMLAAFAILIILSRGPFIIAPVTTRDGVLSILSTDARMRGFGFAAAVFGGAFFAAGLTEAHALARVFSVFGIAIVGLAVGYILPFPASSRALAEKVWRAFSPLALRMIGLLSVAFGAAIIAFAVNM